MCPQCNAPLAPQRFASFVVCAYCGTTVQLDESAVSVELLHEAVRFWNAPQSYQIPAWVSLGDRHWAIGELIAHGALADVYAGRRARWPTELVLLKILREGQEAARFDHEWNALQTLQKSEAPGADTFTTLIPQPILHGDLTGGTFAGRRASIFRWASGFQHTFEDVLRVYPQGIPPRASIWVWRRILEVLSFLHASGMAHGAVLPAHLLVQENEHGVRLVGYGYAGRIGEKMPAPPPGTQAFYSQPARPWATLTAQLDLVMSARCLVAILGGNPATAALPEAVPPQLAGLVQQVALSKPGRAVDQDAWAIREELGAIASAVYGPPQFMPIVMPD